MDFTSAPHSEPEKPKGKGTELQEVKDFNFKKSKVLELVIRASEKKADTVARHNRAAQKDAAVIATEKLLKNYRKLKWSIQCGTEHTMKLLEDGEYQRLMEREESVQNQNLRSAALLTAGNRVLWNQLNTALDCFREFCENDPRPRVALIVFSAYCQSPVIDLSGLGVFQWIGDAAEEMAYMYSLIFNMLLLLGIIKGADQVTHRIFGM